MSVSDYFKQDSPYHQDMARLRTLETQISPLIRALFDGYYKRTLEQDLENMKAVFHLAGSLIAASDRLCDMLEQEIKENLALHQEINKMGETVTPSTLADKIAGKIHVEEEE